MSLNKVDPKQNFPALEAAMLKYWEDNKIFEKSVDTKSKEKVFSFYDGPPFATGTPHYGHLLAGTIKDVIPRFKTMQGYRVERIWGWDTHGLPIENIVEQELDIKSKIQIEEYGIDKFNELCRSKVLAYANDWKKIVARTGRWVDMEAAYLTMNPEYMESVWWVFKQLYDKDLAYEGHKVMPYCPRCSTPLSNFEVGQGYKDKRDKAITVKFEISEEPNTYLLAWTTTPWTLPGNLALSVGPEIEYSIVSSNNSRFIIATDRIESYKNEFGDYEIVSRILGKELVGKKYKQLFNYYKNPKKAFEIIDGTHVNISDGTGIVHTAPAFGEEDYKVAKAHGIDFFMPVDDLGRFTIDVTDYSGSSVIALETNQRIITELGNKIFKTETITHSYPHCWRCDTPLIYKGVSSWFVAVEKIKPEMIKNNKDIYWLPDSMGHNRFNKLIENAPDWSISRNRFWGTPLPVWKCHECAKVEVIGSIKDLESKTGKVITDIHLHKIQNIVYKCSCGHDMELSGEVFDCWFESGSMPYGSIHYPFENKDKFALDYPADFIAEGVDQTRGWFYSLLVLSTAIFGKSSYKSVIVNGIILAENGQKMSKKLSNYPDPMELINKYGADAIRFYLMASPAVKAEDFRFSEKGVEEVVKKIILTLWNSYGFFVTYANIDNFKPSGELQRDNKMDYWIISETNQLIDNVTDAFNDYDLSKVSRLLAEFIDNLSNWYIRRNRRRFWKSENDTDKAAAYETLYYVLTTYIKLLAPFMPFTTEAIYQNLSKGGDSTPPTSIHLSEWPVAVKSQIDLKINNEIHLARKVVELGLKLRAQEKINVRQALGQIDVYGVNKDYFSETIVDSIKEELNVKRVNVLGKNLDNSSDVELSVNINFKLVGPRLGNRVKEISEALKKGDYSVDSGDYNVLGESFTGEEIITRLISKDSNKISSNEGEVLIILDTTLTKELKIEGTVREFIRKIQDARKKANYSVSDRIQVYIKSDDKNFQREISVKWLEYLKKETLATQVVFGNLPETDYNENIIIDGHEYSIGLKR
ncbi:MAG: isoleucine--tRNA ligase [bacterium]